MILDRGLQYWLPGYLTGAWRRRRLRSLRARQMTHVLFLVCDHFEPAHGVKSSAQATARLRSWHDGYARMQEQVSRLAGLRPVHTWFYPPHHGFEHLPALARMAFEGLGEVELHYHHSNDTEDTLRANLREVLARFRSGGLLLQNGEPPGQQFGFIHGDWALDNSAHGEYCGVNSELSLLQELGCWADLTMPSGNDTQTRKINSIYYAEDDRDRPKSHDWGVDATRGVTDRAGLMLIQGPLALNLRAPGHPRIENASLTTENWGRPDRIRSWIDCHVHVQGRPEWLFIKLHAHGALEHDWDGLFGERAMRMHEALHSGLNDGTRYRLHYVSARQARNVIRAAESGADGDPSQYFDFEIPPPVTSVYCMDTPHEVLACTPQHLHLKCRHASGAVSLRNLPMRSIGPGWNEIKLQAGSGCLDMTATADRVEVELAPGVRLTGQGVEEARGGAARTCQIRGSGHHRLQLSGAGE